MTAKIFLTYIFVTNCNMYIGMKLRICEEENVITCKLTIG